MATSHISERGDIGDFLLEANETRINNQVRRQSEFWLQFYYFSSRTALSESEEYPGSHTDSAFWMLQALSQDGTTGTGLRS